ncbi:MAG: hypothetical protein OXE56_05790 [Gammaproteobacteria bacterium]|nr:hypothetical protein [Gammaproteobacteria bacterium]
MNDPHVKSLIYSIDYDKSVIDWSNAEPLNHDEEDFKIHIEQMKVCFTFKKHYASVASARKSLEDDYIPNWEFDVCLNQKPGTFKLNFFKSDIIDRNPSSPHTLAASFSSGSPVIQTNLAPSQPSNYPKPPQGMIKRDDNVNIMYERYLGYCAGKEPLPNVAYFCLTMLETPPAEDIHKSNRVTSKKRSEAAKHFGICLKMLNRVGDLSSIKGGALARKSDGVGKNKELTSKESDYLKEAVKKMIRCVAKTAYKQDINRN